MSEKGLTTINLKKINRSKVYQYIYKTRQTSKMQIVQDLQMGLSTVSQNLNLLEKEGLIDRNGYFDSTGGRKAQAIQIVSDFRISIGIGILKNMFHITAVDLYGNAFYTETIALPYSNTEEYYRQLGLLPGIFNAPRERSLQPIARITVSVSISNRPSSLFMAVTFLRPSERREIFVTMVFSR